LFIPIIRDVRLSIRRESSFLHLALHVERRDLDSQILLDAPLSLRFLVHLLLFLRTAILFVPARELLSLHVIQIHELLFFALAFLVGLLLHVVRKHVDILVVFQRLGPAGRHDPFLVIGRVRAVAARILDLFPAACSGVLGTFRQILLEQRIIRLE
jgi:hypothetical protein